MTLLDVAHCPADDDGFPVSPYASGSPLPGGQQAWERLGIGNRCETWLAWSSQLWCPVVVKFPRPHQLQHPRARLELRREVAALSGNLHPSLPRLYADGTNEDVPHVVLEYVDGISLADEIADHGALHPTETALLLVQLLSALLTLHRRGLAHVDVKPENVMLRDGRVVLLDFGSSRRIGSLQPAGKLIGTPGYAAPDLESGDPITPAIDVFGVGVTAHETLTGTPTFDPTLAAVDRPAPAHLASSPVAHLVTQLLAIDPDARPSGGDALRELTRLADPDGKVLCPTWACSRR